MPSKTVSAIIAVSLMSSGAHAKTYPFLGTWGDEMLGKGCGDPASTVVITATRLAERKILKIEMDGDWYVVTTRDNAGKKQRTGLYLDGDELLMQEITEPETRTTRFPFVRCK